MNLAGENGLDEFEPEGREGSPSTFVVQADHGRTSAPASASGISQPRIPDRATTVSDLMATVAAYPPRQTYPTSLVAGPTPGSRTDSTARTHATSPVRRTARAVLFAPVTLVSFVARGIWWVARQTVLGVWRIITGTVGLVLSGLGVVARAVYAVLAFIGSTTVRAGAAVLAVARAVASGIWSLVTGTVGLFVNGVKALLGAIARGLHAAAAGMHAAATSLVRTIAFAGAALVTAARAVARGIWGAATGTVGLIVSGVYALGRAASAVCAFIWNTTTTAAGAVIWFARAVLAAIAQTIRNAVARTRAVIGSGGAATARGLRAAAAGIHLAAAFSMRTIAHARARVAALVRGAARAIRGAVTGTAGLFVAGANALGRAAAAVCTAVLGAVASGGAAVASFARSAAQGIRDATARTVALSGAGFAATTGGLHATVTRVARGSQAGLTALNHAAAVAARAALATLSTLSRLAAAASVRTARALAAFVATAARLGGAGAVSLARGADGLRRSAARTTAALSAARETARGAALVSWRRGGRARANLVRHITSLARAAAVAASAASAATRLAFMSPARQAHRRGQRLTVRLTERFHHDVAAARTALAGVPLGRRHGLLATTFAVVLAIAVWTSSGVLMMSRRTPVRPLAAAAPVEAIARTAPAPAPISSAPAVTRPSLPEADVNREASRSVATSAGPTLNAARVRAIWGKTDTRSLDRALATLRSTTLALHRCDMQITATDRAVAHCDEVRGEDEDAAPRPRRVAWTIEFHRPDDRWLIDGISTTSSMARAAR